MATLQDLLSLENDFSKRRRSKKNLTDETEGYSIQNLPSFEDPEADFDRKNLTPTQFRDKYANPADLVSRPDPEFDKDKANLTPLELYRKYTTPLNALAPTSASNTVNTNALAAPYQLQMLRTQAPQLQAQAIPTFQLQAPPPSQAPQMQMDNSALSPTEELQFMQWARQTNNIKHMFDPALRQLWKTNYQVRK